MLPEKLLEILSHPADGALAIVSQGETEPHIANTWNSYVKATDDGRLLIPSGGMRQTEENLVHNNEVKLSIASRNVEGTRYVGAGFLVTGTARFVTEGPDFDQVNEKFPWARAVLEVTVVTARQTL